MAGQVPTRSIFDNQIAADSRYLLAVYQWLKVKFSQYQINATSTQLQAATLGYSAAEANQFGVFLGDLNNLIHVFEGQAPPTNSNVVADTVVFVGLSG